MKVFMKSMNQALYELACDSAKNSSLVNRDCVRHVNAVIEVAGNAPYIASYKVSDWMDGTTVCSYVNGEQQ